MKFKIKDYPNCDVEKKYLDSKFTMIVNPNSKCGLIDDDNNIVIPIEYDNIICIVEDELVKVQKGSSYWVVNVNAPTGLYQCTYFLTLHNNIQYFNLYVNDKIFYGYYDFMTHCFEPAIYNDVIFAENKAKIERWWKMI